MAKCLLTFGNIEHIKAQLRSSLTTVRSSHLTEAIAAAMGYNTHAALLSMLQTGHPTRPTLVDIDMDSFIRRLMDFQYPLPSTVDLRSGFCSADMPDPLWKAFKSRDIDGINSYFSFCCKKNIPYVYIEDRRKYAKLSWDCISVASATDGAVRDPDGRIVSKLYDIYCATARLDPGKSEFYGSAFVGSVDRGLSGILCEGFGFT